MKVWSRRTQVSVAVLVLALMLPAVPAGAQTFDLYTGNAATDVVIPAALPAIFAVSPGGNDATLVLRFTTIATTAWFDATAPYHPPATSRSTPPMSWWTRRAGSPTSRPTGAAWRCPRT